MFASMIAGRVFDPRRIANLAGWWDASVSTSLYDATIGGSLVAADGAVARWEDLSGNANHLTQSTSNNRPLRRTARQNARDMVDFDGSNDVLALTTNLAADVYTAFVVAKKETGTNTFVAFSQSSAYLPYILADGSSFGTFGSKSTGATNYAGNGTQLLNRTTGFQATQDSNTPPIIWIDGAQQTLASTGAVAAATQFTQLGARNVGSLYAKAAFGEVLFYSRILSTNERQAIERYMQQKWGTP